MPWGRLDERGRLLSQTERGIDLRQCRERGLENLLPLYLNVLMTCSFFQGFDHCLGGLGSNFTILKLSCTVSASFLFALFAACVSEPVVFQKDIASIWIWLCPFFVVGVAIARCSCSVNAQAISPTGWKL